MNQFPPVPGAGMAYRPFGARYPDQLPAAVYGTAVSDGLTSLAAAIANRNAARVDIPVVGDSITEGQGATAYAGRWIAQANRAIRAAYPTAANGSSGAGGFIPIQSTGETSFTWPVALTGGSGAFVAPIGPVRDAITVPATASYTWTAPTGTTSCKIMYFDDGSGSTFSYKVNSGSATNVVQNTGAGDGILTASITITAGQVLTVAWVSGSTVILEGIVPFSGDESSGITFHALGHFGWQAGQQEGNAWNQTGYANQWQTSIAALTPGAAAVGIMLGVNDAAAYSAAGFQANLGTFAAGLRATPGLTGVPLWLIIPYQPFETLVDPSGWPAYAAAVRNVAAAYAPAFVTDLNYRMPAVGDGGGTYYADDYHPDNLGHALIGEIAGAGLRVALWPASSRSPPPTQSSSTGTAAERPAPARPPRARYGSWSRSRCTATPQ